MTASKAPAQASTRMKQRRCPRCAELEVKLNETHSERGYWKSMHGKALEREEKLKGEIEELKAKLKLREDQLFRRKSEKSSRTRGSEQGNKPASSEMKRKRGRQSGSAGYGRHLHEALPVIEEWTDLREEDKCCPRCHRAFAPLQDSEDSEVVEVEVRGYRRRIRRRRYRPTCSCKAVPGTVIAPGVAKLIPQGSYGVSFWVQVLLDKFLLQRPSNRLLLHSQAGVGPLGVARDDSWGPQVACPALRAAV